MTIHKNNKILSKASAIIGKVGGYLVSSSFIDIANKSVSYILVIFLWAPHGARECAETCNGPYFISPMIGTFLMPNWTMDMNLHGWLLQVLFAPPLILLLYIIFWLEKKKYFSFLKIYAVSWGVMWLGILVYYNLVFWSPTMRDHLIPIFMFTNKVKVEVAS
jgi:hypothetical protein